MEYWENINNEPMEKLRNHNWRNRKSNHRYRCPVCYKTYQNYGKRWIKHLESHSVEEIEKWAPSLMKYVVVEDGE